MTLLEAIAKYEGFGADLNNRPTRNQNPGNIEWGAFAQRNGATRIEEIPGGYSSTPRYAYFPDAETGWRAMKELYDKNYRGLTVEQAITKHAPPSENDTEAYIKFVTRAVGCERTVVIDSLLDDAGRD